ncbi:DUF1707 domain-containing protein [Geodermatophilus sp. SYSU D00691]
MTAPTDDTTDGTRARIRASDAQREAVVHRLHDAVAAGMLTIDEGHERTTAAFAARYVDELPLLTADLPDPGPAAPVAPGWRAVASTAALQARTTLMGAGSWGAADRTRRRLVLLAGVFLVLLVVVALTAAATAEAGDFGGWDHHRDRWD